MKDNETIPMNLQFFSDSNGAGASEGNSGGTDDADTNNTNGEGAENKPTFDDLLADKTHQAEFDRRVQKALETAKSKWEKDAEEKTSEAAKLAKMSAEQKAEYERKRQEAAIAEREAAVVKRELMAEAKGTLSDKGISPSLAEFLSYKDAESCNKSIDTLASAFETAVQKAVEDRIKGGKSPKQAPEEGQDNGAANFLEIIKENQSKR